MDKRFRDQFRLLSFLLFGLILMSPVSAISEPWRFIAVGDTRGSSTAFNPTILPEIVNEILQQNPKFVIVPGDLATSGSAVNFRTWKAYMDPVYKAGIGVYPVIGNHDVNAVAAFTEAFGPSIPDNGPAGELDRTYAIEYENVLVLAMDTYVHPGRVNQAWVDQVLSANYRPHVFAFGHMPAFKANNPSCLDDYPAERDNFWKSLRNAGARVYFSGHDHFYDHARIDDGDLDAANDMHQMIVGGGGAPLHSSYAYDGANTSWTPQNVYHDQQFGYVLVEVDGNAVTMSYYQRVGPHSYAPTSEVFSYTVDTQLAAPTGLIAIPGEASVNLRWNPSAGATAYNVKRSDGDDGLYITVATGITETAFADSAVLNGATYYYVVTAVNASGESANSAVASAIPQSVPPAPSGTIATEEPGAVMLQWLASPGATGYNIKRSTAQSGPYDSIASVTTDLTYTDRNVIEGTTYFYVVSAFNAAGESLNSVPSSAAPLAMAPGPFTLTAAPGCPGIRLDWTASAGAVRYTLKRAKAGSESYNEVASGLTELHYTDTVPSRRTYHYVVTAISSMGTADSNQVSATANGRYRPGTRLSRWHVYRCPK